MNKKVTAIGLSAGLLAGLGAGLLLEHSGGASAERGAVNVVPLGDNGATAGNGMMGGTAASSSVDSVIQALVDDGTLTQAQADKVLAALQAAGVGGAGMGGPGMGGAGVPGDGDGDGGRGRGGMMGAGLDEVATLLGISTADIQTALAEGQTLKAIAEAHGKTAQDVIDVLVQAVKNHFAPEVASGEHTQDEADAMIAAATQQITDAVNNGGSMGGPGMGPRGDGDGDHAGFPGDDQGGTSGGTIDGGPADAPTTSADA